MTTPDGRYIFDGLDPDAYVVEVDDSTLPAGFTTTPTGDPDGDGDNISNPIVIGPGDVYRQRGLRLRPAHQQHHRRLRSSSTATPTAILDGGTDSGIAGVTVTLFGRQRQCDRTDGRQR